jgi:hypothetical protein
MQWYQNILGVNVQNFMQLDGRADFLRPFTLSRVPGLMRLSDRSDKGTLSNVVPISEKHMSKTLEMIRQAFGAENINSTRRQVKSKV